MIRNSVIGLKPFAGFLFIPPEQDPFGKRKEKTENKKKRIEFVSVL